MRGLSASGASRTLVLVDGVPLNDSFGGWIAWNRLPPVAIDRIEVLRGPAGDLYGATALGGVIQVLTFVPLRPLLRLSLEAGSAATTRGSVFAGAARGLMYGFVSADAGRSDGFLIAAPENRGPVDTRAGAHHRSMQIGIGVRPPAGLRIDLKGSVFGEERQNGTPLQINDTDLRDAAVSVAGPALRGWWSARLFGQTQRYDQTFSAVSADRSREDLIRVQRVPSESGGGDVEWLTAAGRWRWLIGAQARRVSGTSRETQVTAGLFRDLDPTGGREDRWAVFGQAVATAAHDRHHSGRRPRGTVEFGRSRRQSAREAPRRRQPARQRGVGGNPGRDPSGRRRTAPFAPPRSTSGIDLSVWATQTRWQTIASTPNSSPAAKRPSSSPGRGSPGERRCSESSWTTQSPT